MGAHGYTPVVMVPAFVYEDMVKVVRSIGLDHFILDLQEQGLGLVISSYGDADTGKTYDTWMTAFNLLKEIGRGDVDG